MNMTWNCTETSCWLHNTYDWSQKIWNEWSWTALLACTAVQELRITWNCFCSQEDICVVPFHSAALHHWLYVISIAFPITHDLVDLCQCFNLLYTYTKAFPLWIVKSLDDDYQQEYIIKQKGALNMPMLNVCGKSRAWNANNCRILAWGMLVYCNTFGFQMLVE